LENYLKIRKELSKYSKNLLKKKEIIVFNKIDLVAENVVKERIFMFKKKIKKNIYKTSVLKNKDLINIKKLLISSVYK
jgi:GTP-binding protein